MTDLFQQSEFPGEPLASRMRPETLDGYVGQSHLVGEGKPLRTQYQQGHLHSMIFWGPPGTGKTTLALILAQAVDAEFIVLSAVLSGVKDIREAVAQARQRKANGRRTVLFVDEVHRFNKSQQDAFLPHVEDGTVTFIGATTENPSFELNNALLSRARVYRLRALDQEDLALLLDKACALSPFDQLQIDDAARSVLLGQCDGDARKLLNVLEVAADLALEENPPVLTVALLQELLKDSPRRFDKGGDIFYEQISALHKSVRGSDPDAALYWLARMLDGGCDPLYIARRVVRMASEDIGNADPRALRLALDGWEVQQRLGSPEGELAIAQAVAYLAVAAKSNAVYNAFNRAMDFVRTHPTDEVPMHLRNAPTGLMKEEGYGREYRYAHDEPGAFVAGEVYFPESTGEQRFYQPVDRGLEIRISEKLESLRNRNRISDWKRYQD